MFAIETNKIFKGHRHNTLYETASNLQREGANLAQIESVIRFMNLDQCQPPVTEKRILDLMKTVKKWFAK